MLFQFFISMNHVLKSSFEHVGLQQAVSWCYSDLIKNAIAFKHEMMLEISRTYVEKESMLYLNWLD